ncbi:putative acetyltransferase [Limimaricola soesokkakensis]|uniref:Putative N-acetyltransferase YjaB n=2 Tax=Limimaricola soesokkakensis TaxID=1343159 RepID=A0A1X6YEH0_9RHOB|nr:putative acetyltransferase [Limimaricola soesokkakensis]SLN18836.1 putative N-acetyltransferase YjaB [Limimaricola soesokkakensis]
MTGPLKVETIPEAAIIPLASLWHDGWHEAHDHLVPSYDAATRSRGRFADRLRREHPSGRMVRLEDRPVGLCLTSGAEISQLFVDVTARRLGVGRVLLADVERHIALSGHDEASLTVVQGNDQARGFYERHGWRRDGLTTIEIKHGSRSAVLYLWRFAKTVMC